LRKKRYRATRKDLTVQGQQLREEKNAYLSGGNVDGMAEAQESMEHQAGEAQSKAGTDATSDAKRTRKKAVKDAHRPCTFKGTKKCSGGGEKMWHIPNARGCVVCKGNGDLLTAPDAKTWWTNHSIALDAKKD